MSALAAVQRDFLRALSQGDGKVSAALDSRGGIDAALGLGIYQHAYHARLREALQNDHAALAAVLGDEAWEDLVVAYVLAHPSQQASLRRVGDALPGFLRQHAPYASQPVLADLAAFERALLDSFDAADAPGATWAQLVELPPTHWPGLRLQMAPSLRRQAMRTPAVECWRAIKRGDSPAAALAMPAARSDWAIWRDDALVTRFRSLADDESALLDHFLCGGDFADGCELLQRWHDAHAVPAAVVAFLQRWSEDGLVARWRG